MTLQTLLSNPVAQAFGIALLHFIIWQAALRWRYFSGCSWFWCPAPRLASATPLDAQSCWRCRLCFF